MDSSGQILARLRELADDPALVDLSSVRIAQLLSTAGAAATLPDQTAPAGGTAAPGPGPSGRPEGPRRWQDELIESHIPAGASVLDLGCGRGELLARLIQSKNVRCQGVEQDPAAVFDCVARGVPVLQADLDEGLRGFADRSFDYVVLEETLQTLHRPAGMLREMLRVGRNGILSFPNFAHWRVRLDLLLRGRMPTTRQLPHHWFDTPNIHLLSLRDFLDWAERNGVRLVAGHALAGGRVRPLENDDNLLAEEVLLVVDRG